VSYHIDKLRRVGKRYSHYYNGKFTSRGARAISKITKGMKCGNVHKILDELRKVGKNK
jgi:hypothetical protein